MKTFIWAVVGVLVIVLIIVYARGHASSSQVMDLGATTPSTSTSTAPTSTTTTTTTSSETTTMNTSTTTTTADGLKITVLAQGTGTGAANGDTVTVNYTGSLTDGTVFDSNVDLKFGHVSPFSFQLGAGQVIKGWDEGVLGMKVGEKRHLEIPAALGYGAGGMPPTIPANATLEFDVEVTAITHA